MKVQASELEWDGRTIEFDGAWRVSIESEGGVVVLRMLHSSSLAENVITMTPDDAERLGDRVLDVAEEVRFSVLEEEGADA